ncbi:MAG: ATP-binding protein [Thermodesulfovibrionales bacterium]
MKRKIIHIDESRCTGCGLCIPGCPEGAIQLIDNKARVVSELYCDGLGACIGYCPEGAITFEEREALPYDERKVMASIVKQGQAVIRAHIDHLREHGEEAYLSEAMKFLDEHGIEFKGKMEEIYDNEEIHTGCLAFRSYTFQTENRMGNGALKLDESKEASGKGQEILTPELNAELSHWPIQLHLIPAMSPDFQGQNLLLCADCVAYTYADFHRHFLREMKLAIACPKLDSHQEVYREKLTAMIDHAKIKSMTVVTMEVPCCRGLLMIAKEAARAASRSVGLKWIVVSIKGEILREEWIQVDERASIENI